MAKLAVYFRPLALDDIAAIAAFCAQQEDERLVKRFLDSIDQATERIAAFPLSHPKYYMRTSHFRLARQKALMLRYAKTAVSTTAIQNR